VLLVVVVAVYDIVDIARGGSGTTSLLLKLRLMLLLLLLLPVLEPQSF
jgi:hypothetical protein